VFLRLQHVFCIAACHLLWRQCFTLMLLVQTTMLVLVVFLANLEFFDLVNRWSSGVAVFCHLSVLYIVFYRLSTFVLLCLCFLCCLLWQINVFISVTSITVIRQQGWSFFEATALYLIILIFFLKPQHCI